jgi:hypothetical protein
MVTPMAGTATDSVTRTVATAVMVIHGTVMVDTATLGGSSRHVTIQ